MDVLDMHSHRRGSSIWVMRFQRRHDGGVICRTLAQYTGCFGGFASEIHTKYIKALGDAHKKWVFGPCPDQRVKLVVGEPEADWVVDQCKRCGSISA